MADLAFVLLRDPTYPSPDGVIASARALGIELTPDAPTGDMQTFALADGSSLIVALMPPHPAAGDMPTGPTSVTPDEVAGELPSADDR